MTPVGLHDAAELWRLVRTPPAIEGFPDPQDGPEGVARWLGEVVAEGTCVWVVRHLRATVGLVTAHVRRGAIAVLGYSIDGAWSDDELAAEALRAAAGWLFEARACHRIELRVATSSLALWRIAQQAGFSLEGVARESWRWGGVWHDARNYAVLRREWQSRQHRPATRPMMMRVVT